MRFVRATVLLAAAIMIGAGSVRAATSASFRLEYQHVSNAGGRSTSASFALTDCLGAEPEAPGRSSSASFVLYAACAAAIPAGLPADDDDGDGVDNGVEAAAPNGGDGNGDGIPDQAQGNVASLPAASGKGYLTLEACVDGACTTPCQARQVTALAESDLPLQSELFFPFGLLGFTLDCSSANVHILYHSIDQFAPGTVYEKYGPNPPGSSPSFYYALPGVLFGSEAVGSDPAVASATFVLTDGGIGDATPVDGRIVDPGGPAMQTPRGVPALGAVPLALAVLVLALTAWLALLRRHPAAAAHSGSPRS